MFTSVGKLIYDPHKTGIRIIKSADWWMILKTDEGIVEYYKYWIRKYHNVKFEQTIWGSHISVNRGFPPPNKTLWGKHTGEEIEFTYSNRIYLANDIFFCVDAYSARLEEIREELGLTRLPNYGFHVTIGRLDSKYKDSGKATLKAAFNR
ncbi:hypothetical protein [Acinetobacter sp.]|uniref:hypothetical protein n=1 Tax=Acinetobacter sp. TaxID=472 RepID=UPI003751834F